MKFTPTNIENLAIVLDKMQRFFAYKYEISKEEVAFVIKGHSINIMIEGKLRETIIPKCLDNFYMKETTGEIVKGKY